MSCESHRYKFDLVSISRTKFLVAVIFSDGDNCFVITVNYNIETQLDLAYFAE